MNPEFEDWMYENFKQKTLENTMRSSRHLENAGVTVDQRDSFKKWIVVMKRRGYLNRTLNLYIKCYNRYLLFLRQPKIELMFKTGIRLAELVSITMDDSDGIP